jgi:Clp amino terminal domain, pathogenicity island component
VEDSPTARLRLAIELGQELTALSDDLIGRCVSEARAAGVSWTEIGQVFGTSKQAVQQRYGAAAADPGAPAARQALDRAVAEARGLSHDYVGTEHALLALTDGGVAGEVLAGLGVTRDRILATPCMTPGRGERDAYARLALMPRLKQALEHSRRIADGLGSSAPDTEHLLAGLVAVPDGMAVEILRRLRVSAGDVRSALGARLGVEPGRLGPPRRRRRRLLAAAR